MPKGQYIRRSQEARRLGCEFADLYYAGIWNITTEEAQTRYRCSTACSDSEMCNGKKSPECPFKDFPGCLDTSELPKDWKLGYTTGKLSKKTAKLIPLDINYKTFVECSECKTQRIAEYYPPNYCRHCGARFE